MRTYELYEDGKIEMLKATEGERIFWIPTDPANSDYAEYLALQDWLAEGKKKQTSGHQGTDSKWLAQDSKTLQQVTSSQQQM
jgi:hypothetical protein